MKGIKLNEMKEFILSNPNANTVIFYNEAHLTKKIADFYLDFVRAVKEKKLNLKLLSTSNSQETGSLSNS